ncbi:Bloom syndrome protein -like protein, partial [Caligus rogercresseyi]
LKSHFDIHSFRLIHLSAINAALLNNVTSLSLCPRRVKEFLCYHHCSSIPPGIPHMIIHKARRSGIPVDHLIGDDYGCSRKIKRKF